VKLRYTRPALADLEQLLDHIQANSPKGARRVQLRIKSVIALLVAHPKIGTPTDNPKLRRMTTLPFPYLVFYEVADDEITIHAIRHGARDLSDP
jgi:toxin ParE1/3/4